MSSVPRNLSVFSLPPAILSNLAVRTIAELDEPPVDTKAGPSKQPPPPTTQGALSCQSCPNTSFETVEEQRTHFKTDWHRYNAKARIEGKKVVKGEEWDDMADGMFSMNDRSRADVKGYLLSLDQFLRHHHPDQRLLIKSVDY
jgi:hypothetical protein